MDFTVYLQPTEIIDSRHPRVSDFARMVTANTGPSPTQRAVAIYYAVRDGIRYDPYVPFHLNKHYQASRVLKHKRGYCVCKASLLCALGRSLGIPSRVGFATVRNHLATRELLDYIGSDLFVYHGYTEFFLENKWVKATPAFNQELCHRHRVAPLEFNGREDSVFQAYNQDNRKFMEYVAEHGTYADIPVDTIVAAWKSAYGRERVQSWISQMEAAENKRDFESETAIQL